jgi:hypothetical protein
MFTKEPLPKLPVPELKSTLEKYLRCIMPIVNEENYKRTERIAHEFIKPGGVGEKLQDILIKKANSIDNWVGSYFLSKKNK